MQPMTTAMSVLTVMSAATVMALVLGAAYRPWGSVILMSGLTMDIAKAVVQANIPQKPWVCLIILVAWMIHTPAPKRFQPRHRRPAPQDLPLMLPRRQKCPQVLLAQDRPSLPRHLSVRCGSTKTMETSACIVILEKCKRQATPRIAKSVPMAKSEQMLQVPVSVVALLRVAFAGSTNKLGKVSACSVMTER